MANNEYRKLLGIVAVEFRYVGYVDEQRGNMVKIYTRYLNHEEESEMVVSQDDAFEHFKRQTGQFNKPDDEVKGWKLDFVDESWRNDEY